MLDKHQTCSPHQMCGYLTLVGWFWEGVGEYVFVREPGGIRLTLCELYMNISP